MPGSRWIPAAAAALLAWPVAGAAGLEGRLQWAGRVELAVPVSGVVRRVPVQPGQTVKRGAVLLELDLRGFRAAREAARARLAGREADLAEARRERERAEELYERTVLSDHELRLARIAHTQAKAAVAEARAALTRAELELEYATLRAPFDAVVLERRAAPGQVVSAALAPPVLLVVAEAGRRAVRVVVDRAVAATLRPRLGRGGFQVKTAAGRWPARLVALEPREEGGAAAVFVAETGDAGPWPGIPAEVILP